MTHPGRPWRPLAPRVRLYSDTNTTVAFLPSWTYHALIQPRHFLTLTRDDSNSLDYYQYYFFLSVSVFLFFFTYSTIHIHSLFLG